MSQARQDKELSPLSGDRRKGRSDADRHRKKPSKLRQTCDACSEAKVKCDKGSPQCGRCDRLSYDCVYSPARRIGRPRPRSPRLNTNDRDAIFSEENNSTSQHRYRDRTSPNNGAMALGQPEAAPISVIRQPEQEPEGLDRAITNYIAENETMFNGIQSTLAPDIQASDPWGNDLTSQPLHWVGRGSSVDEEMGPPGLDTDESEHSSTTDDCAVIAVETLQMLVSTSTSRPQGSDGSSSATGQTGNLAVEVIRQQIHLACKQLTRILLCSCSTDTDTALVTASLAGAILDVAKVALCDLKPAGWTLDNEQHTILALGTLPRLTQVVTLFNHRYSATQDEGPLEALTSLAASLRANLRSLAEETTNRFLDNRAMQ